jgi:autotransporter-associated beta strand protein
MKPKLFICLTAVHLCASVCHADTVFSWETGTEGWFSSNSATAPVAVSTTHATDGSQSLAVTLPMSSMWYNDSTRIQLDEAQKNAIFDGAQTLTLDVSYPNPGYNSWSATPTVEMVVEDQGYTWNSLGTKELVVDGTTTCSWTLSAAQATAFATGTSAKIILRFVYGNGGATGENAVFYIDKLTSTDPPPPPPFTSNFYWKGTVSSSWTANNWKTAENGLTATPTLLPTDGTEAVAFSAVGATNLSTVLGADQDVLSVNFTGGSGVVKIGGSHMLTIGTGGITANENSGSVTINTTGQVTLNGDQLWRNDSIHPLTVSSEITGGYKLTTGGTGTTVLTKANSHFGGIGMKSGRLQIGNALALGDTSNVFSADGGTLDLMGFSPTLGGLSGGGVITSTVAGTSTLTVSSSYSNTYLGKLNDGAPDQILALVKSGSESQTLSGLSSFTGNITVTDGTLIAGAPIFGAPTASGLGNSQTSGRIFTVGESGVLRFGTNNVFGNQNADFSVLPTIIVNRGVMDATRYNTLGNITLNAATLSQSSSDSGNYEGYQFKGDIEVTGNAASSISSAGKGNHLGGDTYFTVADVTGSSAPDLVISSPLLNQSGDFGTAPGGLTKSGPGTASLDASNSFMGTASVVEGTLRVSGPFLGDCTVDISSNGSKLNLDFSGIDIIADLKIDGESQDPGEYGSLTSGAAHPIAQITGNGRIYVGPPDPFFAWVQAYPGLTGEDELKTADPDHDGQSNLMEFALNGNPADGTPSGKFRSRIETVGGQPALVITLPVRAGANFIGSAPAVATVLDGRLVYSIEGSNNLTNPDQSVIEVSLNTGDLPTLDEGWSYRSFRLAGALQGPGARGPAGFIRAGISGIP